MAAERAEATLSHGSDGHMPGVTVVNFSHPFTAAQINAFMGLSGSVVDRVVPVPTHFNHERSFAAQAAELVDAAGLTVEQWQSCRLAIVPPALGSIACLVIAEIHGRAGYFVPLVRMRPREGAVPPVFEVAEILDVQGQRDAARARR
jgi:hypothetical protein